MYHGIAQDNSEQFNPIGKSVVVITDENGIFLPEKCLIPVEFEIEKAVDPLKCKDHNTCDESCKNYIEFSTKVRSSLQSQNKELQKVFLETTRSNFIDPNSFDKIPASALWENLFDITSILTSFISKQPWRFVQSFVKIAQICTEKGSDEFQEFLESYAMTFAFSDTGAFINMHSPLFFAYSEYLRLHKDNVDYPVVSFFFLLILKSLALSNDKTYMTAIETFTTLWMRHLYPQRVEIAQQRLTPFIWFINCVFDIGKYTASSQLLKLFIQHGFEKVKHLIVIERFLRQAISPKMFFVLSCYSNPFRDTYMQMFTRFFTYMKDEYFYNVFGSLLRNTMMYTHEMNKQLSSRYSGLKGFKSPILGAFYAEPDVSTVSRDEFDTYWENTDHKGFFRIFHYYLVEYEYKGTEMPSKDETRKRKEFIHALQRGMIYQLRLLSRITNPLDVSDITLLYFHFFTYNMAIDNISLLFYSFAEMLTLNMDVTIENSTPHISHLIRCVLIDSDIDPYAASFVIDCLFPEKQTNKSFALSYASIVLSICSMTRNEAGKVKLELKHETAKMIPKLFTINGKPISTVLTNYVISDVLKKFELSEETIAEFSSFVNNNLEKLKEPLPKFK